MKHSQLLFVSAFAASATAQTPSNFSVVSTSPLQVIGQPGNVNITPSILLPQNDVLDQPSIIFSPTSANDTYAAFMIDPTTSEGAFLHWFGPNLVQDPTNQTLVTGADSSTLIGASYVYPQPPTDGYAHQYVILLYQQPANWTLPANYSQINQPADVYGRFPFDMADFQRAAGLDDPVGANWFRVLNGTAEQTSAIATATVAPTSSTGSVSTTTAASVPSFTGVASAFKAPYQAAAGIAGTLLAFLWWA